MTEGDPVEAPMGFTDFCMRHPEECSSSTNKPRRPTLTAKRAAELVVTQLRVNRRIAYATDRQNHGKGEFWTYPQSRGDCEDYALEKRRRLIALGWPRSALLLTGARMMNGQKHLVLVAVTDKGDFVLDNTSEIIRPWKSVNYRWLSRQSRFDESDWIALAPGEPSRATLESVAAH